MKTVILDSRNQNSLNQAAELLLAGKLVAVPTETVYGLAADATNPIAVDSIFRAKGRPANHPLIVHITGVDQLDKWAIHIPNNARKLAETFWPGPLTLLLKKSPKAISAVTGNQDTIAIRAPANPSMQELLKLCGLGLAAPSANPYKSLSPTKVSHVYKALAGKIDAILDGGECVLGIESTILDLTNIIPRILRPGPISVNQIEEILKIEISCPKAHSIRISGNLASHYMPKTPIFLYSTDILIHRLKELPKDVACLVYDEQLTLQNCNQIIHISSIKSEYSRLLYQKLHEIDAQNFREIWVEKPPQCSEWFDVNDRLKRAAQFDD